MHTHPHIPGPAASERAGHAGPGALCAAMPEVPEGTVLMLPSGLGGLLLLVLLDGVLSKESEDASGDFGSSAAKAGSGSPSEGSNKGPSSASQMGVPAAKSVQRGVPAAPRCTQAKMQTGTGANRQKCKHAKVQTGKRANMQNCKQALNRTGIIITTTDGGDCDLKNRTSRHTRKRTITSTIHGSACDLKHNQTWRRKLLPPQCMEEPATKIKQARKQRTTTTAMHGRACNQDQTNASKRNSISTTYGSACDL
eukprot:scaffold73600_cov17-Tisochrysis_lutea.AAC.1